MADTPHQWTIKSVEPDVRNSFILAARRANVSMGAWFNTYGPALVQAFLDHAEPVFPPALVPGNAVVPATPTTGNGGNLDAVERLSKLAIELSTGNPKARALTTARKVVEARLKALAE
jgi:hypothetical protein